MTDEEPVESEPRFARDAGAQRSKAHHFVPVAHLARFSGDPHTVQARDRRLHVFDKRRGIYRPSRTANVAFENDLYTARFPDLSGLKPEMSQLIQAVFDPTNKDSEIETDKVEIEERGLAAINEIETWPAGRRSLSDDDRAPFLAYVGLLLAQHPTMMEARRAAISERYWAAIGDRVKRDPMLERLTAEMVRGSGALAFLFDGFALAHELNYLAWEVIHWESPRLILGDVAVAAWFPPSPLGVGHPWQPDSKLIVPISPSCVVILGGIAEGVCLVQERGESRPEVDLFNVMSWARSRSEVFAATQEDLERVASQLGPLPPTASHSMQLPVRMSVLPNFAFDADGGLVIIEPEPPDGEEIRRRLEARLNGPVSSDR